MIGPLDGSVPGNEYDEYDMYHTEHYTTERPGIAIKH